jgi:pimeloyl-ACP methyl ester carboxylesterase
MCWQAYIAHVLAPDLPGHGRSAPPGPDSVAAYSAWVIELLEALGLERATLAGHSMGAAVALEAAIAAPNRIVGLALIGAGARLRVAPDFIAGLEVAPEATIARLVEAMYPGSSAHHLRGPAAAEYLRDPATLRADFLSCDGWDARGRLAALACPALVVCGEEDALTPPRLAHELMALLSGADLTLLPGVGHAPMLEAPQATVGALRTWLSKA